jgi:succinyl-CoA synthetase beta subunit
MKAQILEGGRGKAGLIRSAENEDQASQQVLDLFFHSGKEKNVKRILVEKRVGILAEYYMGVVIDELSALPVFILGTLGGMDIEEISKEKSETIFKLYLNPWGKLSGEEIEQFLGEIPLRNDLRIKLRPYCGKMIRLFFDRDCILAEINPLAISQEGELVALDAKMIVDDNSLFRHPDFKHLEEESSDNPLENEANRKGFSYVKLDGDIGVISHGAGLGMLVVDMIGQAGGRAANFLDIKGHEREKNRLQEVRVKNEMDIVLSDPSVKAILFNVFGGLTRCEEVAMGLRNYLKDHSVEVPMVVRLYGTGSEKVSEILKDVKITLADDLNQAIFEVIRMREKKA